MSGSVSLITDHKASVRIARVQVGLPALLPATELCLCAAWGCNLAYGDQVLCVFLTSLPHNPARGCHYTASVCLILHRTHLPALGPAWAWKRRVLEDDFRRPRKVFA